MHCINCKRNITAKAITSGSEYCERCEQAVEENHVAEETWEEREIRTGSLSAWYLANVDSATEGD